MVMMTTMMMMGRRVVAALPALASSAPSMSAATATATAGPATVLAATAPIYHQQPSRGVRRRNAARMYRGIVILSDGSTVEERFSTPGRVVVLTDDRLNSPPFVTTKSRTQDEQIAQFYENKLGVGSAAAILANRSMSSKNAAADAAAAAAAAGVDVAAAAATPAARK
ncbi:hypothetical protein CAOG_06593 [Capsaspora owczarzaki ATCC 30864]|uniref:Uncharacterized protein n=1 Tax=Capsaspora owczarzaki (strain ATCC 30864) TaxID=595528 RepID=A0A0D2WVJ7_CAPO3|nr:hypothetical protein CAOG_06593 [Capsaspora owczarzaki ATCC 30864]KJE96238.1 hypothetical protein CAOG_006593 [Capsaspora owczarzaki ATCC 30864]|eukprot:XP_004345342.2 hypothetical protein CAOG_06593 [Capsaspora owczarzaki ATCC 30864]